MLFCVYLRDCDRRVFDEYEFWCRARNQHTISIGDDAIMWSFVYFRYDSDIVMILCPLDFLHANERAPDQRLFNVFSIEKI